MNAPKFKVGDKVVQTVYQEKDETVMRTNGTIEFVENEEYEDLRFLYWMQLENRTWIKNGVVVKDCKMSGSGAVSEIELELIP